MLEVAFKKKREDPYIIDSLGWGMYLTGRYKEAEILLQKAVQLMPLDPIVNDHYADILWKLNKKVHSIELGSMVDTVDDLKTRSWMVDKKEIINKVLI